MKVHGNHKAHFLAGEGDRWFERNRDHIVSPADWLRDPVLVLLKQLDTRARATVELGCSTGYRLAALDAAKFGVRTGIDPSRQAVSTGRTLFREIELKTGTCDQTGLPDESADLLIFGFCLYPNEFGSMFSIAAEANRLLEPGGTLIIYDVHAEKPYRNVYSHVPDLFVHKMDFRRLFTWNPLYTELRSIVFECGDIDTPPRHPDDACIVSAIRKGEESACETKARDSTSPP